MSKFKEGDVIRKIKDHYAIRIVVEVREDLYEVTTKLGAITSKSFELGHSYVHSKYELDPIEASPLGKALR